VGVPLSVPGDDTVKHLPAWIGHIRRQAFNPQDLSTYLTSETSTDVSFVGVINDDASRAGYVNHWTVLYLISLMSLIARSIER
jgi:hypothetical protein